MSTVDQIIEILQFIRKLQKEEKTDEEITKSIEHEFKDFILYFNRAELMDDILGCEKLERTFWRAAYEYPVEGQIITIHEEQCRVANCGFFTFAAELLSGEEN